MRISTGMIFDAGVNSINRQTASLLHLQQQVSSGRRILSPSDDPVAAARALEVTQSQRVVAQFSVNHNNATSSLGLEEAQLTSATEIIARVRELTVQAGNTALSSSDRKAIAFELRARFDEMQGLANATDGSGQYIFSGYMGATKPFGGSVDNILDGNKMQYFGDDGQRLLQISPSRFLEVSDSGNDVFMRVRNGNGYFTTSYPTDPAKDGAITNTGSAIIDAGSVTDPTQWNNEWSANQPMEGVRARFYVDDFPGSPIPPATYYDLVRLDSSTNPATEISLLDGVTARVDPTTSAELTTLRRYTPGQPVMLRSQGAENAFDFGANFTIEGTPKTGDSFDIKASTSQSVFETVAKLIGGLERMLERTSDPNNPNALPDSSNGMARLSMDVGAALTNLDQATDNILRVRAAIGSRMGEIESVSSVNEDLNLQYQQTLSDLQDLDYAQSITDLMRKQTDLQAAQQSFARVSQLSLFNYL